MKKLLICPISVLLLSSCVSTYEIDSSKANATFKFNFENNFGGSTSTTFNASIYNDLSCLNAKTGYEVDSIRVLNKFSLGEEKSYKSDPIQLNVDKPIVLTLEYQGTRIKQNLFCSYTLELDANDGGNYEISYHVDSNLNCSVNVFDLIENQAVNASRIVKPASNCPTNHGFSRKAPNGNGTGYGTNWKITVQ